MKSVVNIEQNASFNGVKVFRVSDQLLAAMYNQTLPHRGETMQKLGNTTEM